VEGEKRREAGSSSDRDADGVGCLRAGMPRIKRTKTGERMTNRESIHL
jgi:hypothetical protein